MPIPFLAFDDDLTPFPEVDKALQEPNGLLMAGGNLSPARLTTAYRSGIFPWFEEGEPILWWSPDPRCVIWPDEIRISRSLGKTHRKGHLHIKVNTSFRDVMKACAEPRAGSTGTWITENMLDAYETLNQLGIAKSVEVWQGETLVGGLYGIVVGQIFVGESMFSRVSDASKVALVHLAQSGEYKLIDCQLSTPHLSSMGAREIPRRDYIDLLRQHGELDIKMLVPTT